LFPISPFGTEAAREGRKHRGTEEGRTEDFEEERVIPQTVFKRV
jgi:hypothetical protein